MEECNIEKNNFAIDDKHFVFGAIPIVANMLDKLMERELTVYDMTAKQWLLIAVVENQFEKPPTIKQAAKAMGSSHQNIKQVALKLERKGFIELKKDKKDSRVTRLIVTDQSRKFWDAMEKTSVEFVNAVFKDIDKEDITVMRQCIGKIAANLSQMENNEDEDENEKD